MYVPFRLDFKSPATARGKSYALKREQLIEKELTCDFFDNIFISVFFYFACKLTECIRIWKSGFDTSDTFKKLFLDETKCNQQKNVRLALILCYSANLLKKTPKSL